MRLVVDWGGGTATVEGLGGDDDLDALVAAATAALVHGRDVGAVPVETLMRVATTVAARLG